MVIIVNSVDAFWNVVSSGDTIQIGSSDIAAYPPASDDALVAGTKTFSVTLKTAGSSTLGALDLTDPGKTPASIYPVTVNAGTATKIIIGTAPNFATLWVADMTVVAGDSLTVYANASDAYNNFVANVAAIWSLSNLAPATGGVVAGDLVPAGDGKSAVFTGNLVGTCKINAAVSGLTSGITGTITVAPSSAKAITAFGFATPAATGAVNEAAHTIALTVPFGTDVTNLVATFTTTGASVAMGAIAQVSGTTANDFTSTVTYTVTAADASTQAYVVTVYWIGKSYEGGKIAYFFVFGDIGYVAGETHGLIAAAADASTTMAWSNITDTAVEGTQSEIGFGQANTTAIINQPGHTGSAAKWCDDLIVGGYSDWYLPSLNELSELRTNRVAIGGFDLSGVFYWNSTQAGGGGSADGYACSRGSTVTLVITAPRRAPRSRCVLSGLSSHLAIQPPGRE